MPIVEFADFPQRSATHRQWHLIVWPKLSQKLRVVAVGDKIVKVWCHWDPIIKRPRPCPGEQECKICFKDPRRMYAYLAAVTRGDKDKVVLEVSCGCAERMKADGLLDHSLRGWHLLLYRQSARPDEPVKCNSPVRYQAAPPNPSDRIPEKFSVMPSLLRLWGWTEENLETIKANLDKSKDAEPNCLTDFLRQTEEIE